ncbi:MAG: hypothetical protein CMO55_03690 [Verrucomicrobiales bacterium]|nr:hypothetical protein [Verrucomicrobiales bacterium]
MGKGLHLLLWTLVLSWSPLQAAPPETMKPLRNISSIRELNYADARMAPPVQLRVMVISHHENGFDAQDNSGGLFFEYRDEKMPPPGETLEIFGNVSGGVYGPYVVIDELKKFGRKNMPRPLNFRPDFVQTGIGDNRWIKIEGLMVDVKFNEDKRSGQGLLVTGQNDLVIRFYNETEDFDVEKLERLVGSWVELQGSAAPLFNDLSQRIGADIICSSHRFTRVLEEGKDTESVPLNEIGRWDSRRSTPGLLKTSGRVTLIEGPRSFVVQSEEHGARVKTLRPHQVIVDDSVDLVGIPDTEGYFVGLQYATATPAENKLDPIEPVTGNAPTSRAQAFQLINLSGRLTEREKRILNVQVGEEIVPVLLPGGIPNSELPPQGSEIEVTGVKLVDADQRGEIRSVSLALRRAEDIGVVATPSWWTPKRLWTAILLLAACIFLFIIWTLALNRRVKSQTGLIQDQIESNAALEERNRIARELHDTLSQGFSGVGYQLASVENSLYNDPDKAKEKLNTARQMVEHSLTEARDSLSGLRIPSAADKLEFPGSTLSIAQERCGEAGITMVRYNGAEIDTSDFNAEVKYTCHRILLEAVTNAIRHGEPSSVTIEMHEEDSGYVFSVKDNGKGFDTTKPPPGGHFGLQGMEERARQINATISIDSSSDGTRVDLIIPKRHK